MKLVRLAILPLAITSTSAFAEAQVYFSGMIGLSKVDTGITSSTLTTIDDDDTAFEGIIGIHMTDNIAVEAHYANLGEASVTILNGGTVSDGSGTITNTTGATVGMAAEATSMGVSAMVHGSSDAEIIPFAKIGWHSWDLDVPVTVNGLNVGTLSDDGNDLLYGAGLMWKMTDNLALRGEYTGFKFDDETVSMFGVGVTLNF